MTKISSEENIMARLNSDTKPRERAENATMLAIGAIADSLERIADALELIYEDGIATRTKI